MERNRRDTDNDHARSSLEIGDSMIDEEHEALFRLLHQVRDAGRAGGNPGEFSDCLNALGKALMDHFEHEERLLKTLEMPESELQRHLRAHREIVHQYAELSLAMMHDDGIDREDVLTMIQDWILYHLIQFDMKIRPYSLPAAPA